MPSVIICQGSSSAVLYVQECIKRGLEPVIVNPPEVNPDRVTFVQIVGEGMRTINMDSDDDYDNVLNAVKGLDPVAVVCGNSGGTYVADRLGKDLGLRHNNPETTYRRDSKDGMQDSLRDAGLRYIRTSVVASKSDIERFWNDVRPVKAIMKYANGAGSVGNKICASLEDALAHYDIIARGSNIFGIADKILIQEFIEGTEYVVDTVSCEGRHMVSAIWEYSKIVTMEGDIIYDETRLIVAPKPGMAELVKYAYAALDATGFEYGPCHGEFMVDDKGPVLIETNPRPHGGTLIAKYLDECLGNHITDIALDAYLAPSSFFLRMKEQYRPRKHALMKTFNSPVDKVINPVFLRKILEHLRSFRYCTDGLDQESMRISKAIDFETAVADIKMCNSDYGQLMKDCEMITLMETKYFDLLTRGDETIEPVKVEFDQNILTQQLLGNRKVLILADGGSYSMQYGKRSDTPDPGGYDALLYADASRCTVAERFESIINAAERLCAGGSIVVLPKVYRNLPYGSAAVTLALTVAGCTIEVLPKGKEHIIATRY